jgi:acyl carrier protein
MKDVTIEEIVDIFAEVVDCSDVRVDESAVLGDDIPIDSTEMLRILARIEAKYSFRFEVGDILRLKTVGDVIKIVQRYLDARYQQ